MMQQRWTKWKDDNGTYIVPYYFSKSFPGTEENIHTINSHINWFNKACFQIHQTLSDWPRHSDRLWFDWLMGLTNQHRFENYSKELNQCIKLEEVNNFDFRYDSKIRIIDGNGCWSYIGTFKIFTNLKKSFWKMYFGQKSVNIPSYNWPILK